MNKIVEIHQSNLFGVIVEAGCGTSVISALMSQPGASKTVHYGLQPYSKEISHQLYGEFKRNVSKEFIQKALEVEVQKNKDSVNFVLVTSWQLSDGDLNKYCHGWFGFWNKSNNKSHLLHFSFPKGEMMDRLESFCQISKIATDIIHSGITQNINEITLPQHSAILDMAYVSNGDAYEVDYDLVLNFLESNEKDYFLVFNKEGMTRIEDFSRSSNNFIIQKGSFNPIHHGHINLMEESSLVNSQKAFLISTYRYDKPHIDVEELKERIGNIVDLDFTLIICKEIYFYKTFQMLNKWMGNKKFYFPIGRDVINRIYQTDSALSNSFDEVKSYINSIVNDYKDNFKFILFERDGVEKIKETELYNDLIIYKDYNKFSDISSTKIRGGLKPNLV